MLTAKQRGELLELAYSLQQFRSFFMQKAALRKIQGIAYAVKAMSLDTSFTCCID